MINRLLMGTYAAITAADGDYVKVQTAGKDGWMKKADLIDICGICIVSDSLIERNFL